MRGVLRDVVSLSLSEDAYSGDAQFISKANGVQVSGPTSVTASHAAGAVNNFVFSGDWGLTPQSFEVEFINGLSGNLAATGRGLYINQLSYNGVGKISSPVHMTDSGAFILIVQPTT